MDDEVDDAIARHRTEDWTVIAWMNIADQSRSGE